MRLLPAVGLNAVAASIRGAAHRVLYTGHHLQLVLMAIAPGDEIGEEVHSDRDQFFRIQAGEGEVWTIS